MVKRVSINVIAAAALLIAAVFALFPLSAARAETEASAAEAPMCSERLIVINDYDNCLTESEELELMGALSEAASSARCNIGIVITSDLNGMSDREYADSFSDEYFGAGSDSVVLLLLNTYNKPEYAQYKDWISTGGKMIPKLENYINTMFDSIYKKMGDPKGDKYAYNESTKTYGGYDYMSACKEFAASVTRYGGKFVLDGDGVDPGFSPGFTSGFSSGTALVSIDAFAVQLSELCASILKMLGGLFLG